jgi:hypothetical protein
LIQTSYELGLDVLKSTMGKTLYKRTEMIRWVVDVANILGPTRVRCLLNEWHIYFLPVEAVKYVVQVIMQQNLSCKSGLDGFIADDLNLCARRVALECIRKDPQNCSTLALDFIASDGYGYEDAYALITTAAMQGRINPDRLFQIGHQLEVQYPADAYKLALLALKGITIPYNGEQNQMLGEIQWICSLALSHSRGDLMEFITTVVANIKCAPVLSDILRRCAAAHSAISGMQPVMTSHIPYSDSRKNRVNLKLLLDKPPYRLLLDASMHAYMETTNQRLQHISPRHYSDFIEFLAKAQETFKMTEAGSNSFHNMLEQMRITYKGKKKLMCLIREKFCRETRLH